MKKAYGLLALVCVCVYPGLFMYFQNVGEAKIADIFSVTGLFLATAFIILIFMLLLMRNMDKAAGLTCAAMLAAANFEAVSGILNWLPHKHVFEMIVVCALLAAIGILFKKKDQLASNVNLVVLITFSALILINAVPAIPVIVHKMTMKPEKPEVLASLDADTLDTDELPDIYYIILDEYGGPENLKEYFGYDNQDFIDFLTGAGFNVSLSSRNAESIQTVTIVPNLLNLDYVVNEDMIIEERMTYLENPALYEIMQYLGYEIVTCSNPSFLDNRMSTRNFEEQEVFEDKAGYFVLKNSIFIYPYQRYTEKKLLSENPDDKSYGDIMLEAFEYFGDLSEGGFGAKPQFCMGYFAAPHIPFFYRRDGSLNEPEEYMNWLDHENYLGYLEWTNRQVEELINEILENDENSIIILQSDHGARYPAHVCELTGEEDFTEEEEAYQNYVLNCVYYKGEQFDIEGFSGINTVRSILNREFHTNFEMIFCE